MKLGNSNSSVKAEITKEDNSDEFEKSTLPSATQQLMNFIFDKNLMEKTMADAGYDVKKLPLGQLSDETVKQGYHFLT